VGVCAALLALAVRVLAAESCATIRPPGLSPQAVDAIVLNLAREALALDPSKLDRMRTITALGDRRSRSGYSAMYGHCGPMQADRLRTEASAFFDGVSAR